MGCENTKTSYRKRENFIGEIEIVFVRTKYDCVDCGVIWGCGD